MLDPRCNFAANQADGDSDISWGGTPIRTYVIAVREELTTFREAGLFLGWASDTTVPDPPNALGG